MESFLYIGSIPLDIHEVWPHPKLGGGYCQKKTQINQINFFIGHVPLLYKKVITDQISNKSKSRVFEHFMPIAGENY